MKVSPLLRVLQWMFIGLAVGSSVVGCARPGSPLAVPPTEGGVSPEPPFELRIVQELNNGQELLVVADIVPKVAWSDGPVAVRLAVLGEGELLTTKVLSLASEPTTAEALRQKETVQVRLQAPIEKRGSDYQIELLWGEEAAQYAMAVGEHMKSKGAESLPSVVQLRQVTVVKSGRGCQGAGCGVIFTVSGELFNGGTTILSEVLLGVGFRPRGAARLDFNQMVPDNEDQIEVAGLNLPPGASRPFEFEISPPPEERYASSFEPAVRVLRARE